jgi:hypothetical protein
VELPAGDVVGKRLPGGEPNPAALARPSSRRAPRRTTRRKTAAAGAGGAIKTSSGDTWRDEVEATK